MSNEINHLDDQTRNEILEAVARVSVKKAKSDTSAHDSFKENIMNNKPNSEQALKALPKKISEVITIQGVRYAKVGNDYIAIDESEVRVSDNVKKDIFEKITSHTKSGDLLMQVLEKKKKADAEASNVTVELRERVAGKVNKTLINTMMDGMG